MTLVSLNYLISHNYVRSVNREYYWNYVAIGDYAIKYRNKLLSHIERADDVYGITKEFERFGTFSPDDEVFQLFQLMPVTNL